MIMSVTCGLHLSLNPSPRAWFYLSFFLMSICHACYAMHGCCPLQGGGLAAALAGLPALPQSEAEFRMEEYPDEEAAAVPFQQHLRVGCS